MENIVMMQQGNGGLAKKGSVSVVGKKKVSQKGKLISLQSKYGASGDYARKQLQSGSLAGTNKAKTYRNVLKSSTARSKDATGYDRGASLKAVERRERKTGKKVSTGSVARLVG